MGGGSSINAQMANRGSPADYDEWEMRGADGWRWETVLPFFKKVERDIDFDDPLHGRCGNLPIRRVFPENWSEHARSVADAFKLAGHQYIPDQNGAFQDGYYPVAISNIYERRVSSAIAYLTPTIRQRPNLVILPETQVCGLIFEQNTCIGVRAITKQQEQTFHGREVILSSGAIHSPAMLMRSGVGPAHHLQQLGIPVRANVPGVGQRLMDHPSISVASFLRPHARANRHSLRSLQLGMRFSSGLEAAPAGDMALTVSSAFANRISVITLWVNKTFSESGVVQLTSPDWRVEPQVDFNLLADRRDLMRLSAGFRQIAALHDLPPLQAITTDVFPASFTDHVRKVGDMDKKKPLEALKNKVLTAVGGMLLDGPDWVRQFLIRKFVMETASMDEVLRHEQQLETYIKRSTVGVWHCSCSCRMGSPDDPMAVTSSTGVVRGVQNLRIVDASIFPQVPCANTNLPTMMLAEKIADSILSHEGAE